MIHLNEGVETGFQDWYIVEPFYGITERGWCHNEFYRETPEIYSEYQS